jgi:hypothetical protein
MNFEVAGGQTQGGLRLDHRLIELPACRERARNPVKAPGHFRSRCERILILQFGLLEQARRPQRVAVQGERLGRTRTLLNEPFGFLTRALEFRDAQ